MSSNTACLECPINQYTCTRISIRNSTTKSCPHGRKAVVTLRCGFVFDYSLDDPDTAGILEVPPSCPDGTCDGCLYQFLWTGLQACPICRNEELQKIVGECHYGKRTVYRTAPR